MALIQCPECKSEVSSLASACPKCAAPITHAAAAKAVGQGVTTTEVTSKALKKRRLISLAMIFGGLLLAMSGPSDPSAGTAGMALFVAGIVYFIVVSVQKWWHHG